MQVPHTIKKNATKQAIQILFIDVSNEGNCVFWLCHYSIRPVKRL